MASKPFSWFEIDVNDLERAKAVHPTVFQVPLKPIAAADMESWTCPMDASVVGAGGALVYFSCQDRAVEGSRVADRRRPGGEARICGRGAWLHLPGARH